jgi:hypothetical protein
MDDQSADGGMSAETVTTNVSTSDDASSSSSSTLTDDQHDWASSFCGIDTRAGADGGAAAGAVAAATAGAAADAASAGKSDDDDDDSIWGSIKSAAGGLVDKAESVADDVAETVGDAAGGVVDTVKTVAGDVGQAASDLGSGVVNTVETAAKGVGHTVADAGSGLWDTAKTVGGDIASGHLGDALGDAAGGVLSTAGHVASDAAHTVVDTGSAALDTAGKVLIDSQQGVADAATGVISTAGHVASDLAHTVSDAAGPDSMFGRAAGSVGNFATSAADAAVGVVKGAADFDKGLVEGATSGVEGMAKGLVNLGDSAGKEAYALATDPNARASALDAVEHGAEAVGRFEAELITDPSKAMSQVGSSIESGASKAGNIAEGIYKQYEQAEAAGHGMEFIGKGFGQAAVVVGGAVLTGGAGAAAEGGALAGEGAALAGELGEGASVLGELGEGAEAGASVLEGGTGAAGREASLAEDAAELARRPRSTGAEAPEIDPSTEEVPATGQPATEQPGLPEEESPASSEGKPEQPRAAMPEAEPEPATESPEDETSEEGSEPADEPDEPSEDEGDAGDDEEDYHPRNRERAKDRRARQREDARGRRNGDAPAKELGEDEGMHEGPEVGDAKVPLDKALDNAGVEMDEEEREAFGDWVKKGHKGGQHDHYGMNREEAERLRQDVEDFRSETGRGGPTEPEPEDPTPAGNPEPGGDPGGDAGGEDLKRMFHKPRTTGDPGMGPGEGATDKYGNVRYSTAGTQAEQDLALYHEQVHSFLSPKLKVLREFRADLRMAAYHKSEIMRYLEEAIAETVAQFKVNGIGAAFEGLKFPIANGYVTIGGMATEAALGTVVAGGVTYTVYLVTK